MNELSLFMTCAMLLVMFTRGVVGGRERLLEYPFLVSLVMLGWFLPQAVGWFRNEQQLPEYAYMLTMFYAAGCLFVLVLGARLGERKAKRTSADQYDAERLLWGAAALSAVGFIAYSQIFRVEVTLTDAGYTTGIVTVLFFFSKLQFFGLAIALLVTLKRFSWMGAAIVAFDLNTIVGFILFGGRRGPALEVALLVLCTLWFSKRFVPPRVLLILGAAAGALFVNSAGDYRGLVATNERLLSLNELLGIDFLGNMARIGEDGSFEVHNAIMYISAAASTFDYDYGLSYWNFLVFSYVPGQLIGHELKAALMFDLPDLAVEAYGHYRHPGSTFTGFTDSFVAFSFLGVLVFGYLGYLYQRWFREANAGSLKHQLFYSTSVVTGLHAITHGTQWTLIFLLQLLVFTLPLLKWASVKKARRPATPTAVTQGSHFSPQQ